MSNRHPRGALTSTCAACIICHHPRANYRTIYCARCQKRLLHVRHVTICRKVMTEAWNEELDAFICYYIHIKLEDKDPNSPRYMVFDHILPEKAGDRVVACAQFINTMKTDLSEEELWRLIEELAAHFNGKPFDRKVVEFIYWLRAVRPTKPPASWFRTPRPGEKLCEICEAHPVAPRSRYCPRCHKFMLINREDRARKEALKRAYDKVNDCFRCRYTGVILELYDKRNPWYLTFDHRIPGKKGDLVVCAAWVNSMKGDLSEAEFRTLVRELAKCHRGEPFDIGKVRFRHWRRHKMVRP